MTKPLGLETQTLKQLDYDWLCSNHETAKIENFAVEKAVGHTSTSPSRAKTQNELEVFEATSVQIDTSVWSDAFQNFFNQDSLGTFSKTTTDATKSADNAISTLTPKLANLRALPLSFRVLEVLPTLLQIHQVAQ